MVTLRAVMQGVVAPLVAASTLVVAGWASLPSSPDLHAAPAPRPSVTPVETHSSSLPPTGRGDQGRVPTSLPAPAVLPGLTQPSAGAAADSAAMPSGTGEDTTVLTRPRTIPMSVLTMPRAVTGPTGTLLSRPVDGPITSPFGMRFHPVLHVWKLHTGTDFGVPCGTPVGAAADGVVTFTGWGGGDGIRVVVDHGTLAGHHVETTYNHLSAIGVTVGQKVTVHQGLALSGTTGYSTGCHLHFEVMVDGQFTDPVPWLSGSPVVVDLSKLRTRPVAAPTATPTPTPAQPGSHSATPTPSSPRPSSPSSSNPSVSTSTPARPGPSGPSSGAPGSGTPSPTRLCTPAPTPGGPTPTPRPCPPAPTGTPGPSASGTSTPGPGGTVPSPSNSAVPGPSASDSSAPAPSDSTTS